MDFLLYAGIALFVVYLVSVFLFPRTRCRRCSTTGRSAAPAVFGARNYRVCTRCSGKGWHVRPMRRALAGRDKFDGSGVWQGP